MRLTILGVVVAAALAVAAPASADDAHPWDATWFGGFGTNAEGVQIIVAGNDVIGFFFGGDYVDVSASGPVAADGSLTFTWDGGTATLSAKGEDRIITIRQSGAADRIIPLTRDQ
jgi:hypothetical protein